MASKKAKGKRARTRRKFKRNVRDKTTVNEIIKPVSVGDTVQININSSFHSGLPHPRMYGKAGKIIGFQGECPIIQLKDGNKTKKIITHRTHIKKLLQIPKETKE
jgi:large subunit ribosomal protein L21e